MLKFKKDYNLKIISIVISVILLFTGILYPYQHSKDSLRLPLGTGDDTLKRVKRVQDEVGNSGKETTVIPKYGDPDFWPGRMGITQNEFLDLGLMKGSAWSREWILDNVLRRFAGSPPEVIKILKGKITKPRRTHKEILETQKILKSFLEAMQSKEGEQATDKLERIRALIEEFARSKDSYYEELQILRNKHYYSNYWKGTFEHEKPYPDTTECLILLGRMIIILQEINDLLPESQSSYIQDWKRKIEEVLQRREIQAFLRQRNFLNITARYINPYIFAPLEYTAETIPEELKKKIEAIDNDERASIYVGRHVRFTREDAVHLVKRLKANPEFELAREEFSQLIKQFGDLWDIGENIPRPRVKDRVDKHPFLRQFPDGKMRSPLADIDYYCRIAMMILEDGYKLPNIIQPTGTIKLASYKNPLLVSGPTSNIQPVTINLGEDQSALLLSGPNMGGKTTTARGIGLAVLLTQIGFPLPDNDPEVAIFRNIYTVFPSPEQLQAGYGYFSMLVKQLTELIKKTGTGDLVILDEVPIGTDYNELVAIATILIEDLINTGATVIVTGHLKKAFELVAQRTGQQPFMHTVTEEDGKIAPDFGLAPGIAKHSYAIGLMSQVGFPDEIIELAMQYYLVITENKDASASDISAGLSIRDRTSGVSISAQEEEKEVSDATLIEPVVKNLYPEENFAFPRIQQRIIHDLTRPGGWSLSESGDAYMSRWEIEKDEERGKIVVSKKEMQSPLYYTELFVAQGKDFLTTLTKQLLVFREMTERRSRWGKPEYNHQENMEKIQDLEQFLRRLISHLKSLEGEEEIADIIKFFENKISDDLLKLRKKYSGKNTQELDEEGRNNLQQEWQAEWNTLVGNIHLRLIFLDKYAGIARGVIKWGLKPPRFSKNPNTFSLKNSKPFFPNRGFWGNTGPFIENAVEQSFEINPDKPVMVLTGPNSSGKTVMMFNSRMNALFAMNGFYVSGDLEMSRFDSMHTFFGGMNVVTRGESYFLNVISKYADIINRVTPNSLVILDELHGTDNFELAAIQVAVIHYLRSMNCTVIFNTHIRDGLKVADEKVGLDFWQTDVEYDAEKNRVKARYTLSPDPNLEAKSHGLAVASQWLSSDQIVRAREILSQLSEDI